MDKKDFAAPNNSPLLSKRMFLEMEENTEFPREPFQRDRDRIIHSRSFRRLMHKTQIFNANMGDHYRNRLTHTLEVSQIARSIGKILGLNDELIEAIALGHDLGHTPFGHVGERTLNKILSQKDYIPEFSPINEGFKHNFQSLQVVDHIELRCNDYQGINLTLATREGILKHTKRTIDKLPVIYNSLDLAGINVDKPSFTLEGQVVAIADEIAQCSHDLEDGVRSRIIGISALNECRLIDSMTSKKPAVLNGGNTISQSTLDVRNVLIKNLVGYLIDDVCLHTKEIMKEMQDEDIHRYKSGQDVYSKIIVEFSDSTREEVDELSRRIKQWIITSHEISQADAKSEYMIKRMFRAYFVHPMQLPDYIMERYCRKKGIEYNRDVINQDQLKSDPQFIRAICDHIAGMTDQYASREYVKMYYPDYM